MAQFVLGHSHEPIRREKLISAARAGLLLVDDEDNLAQNLAEALTAAGHEVVVSHTVEQALAHNRRLQTAVLDYRLPDGTGLDVARELRARDPSIQILFISGFTGDLGWPDLYSDVESFVLHRRAQ